MNNKPNNTNQENSNVVVTPGVNTNVTPQPQPTNPLSNVKIVPPTESGKSFQQPVQQPVASTVQATTSVSSTTQTPPTAPEQRVKLVDTKVSLKAVSAEDMKQQQDEKETKTNVESGDNNSNNNKSGGKLQTLFLILLFGGLLAFIIYIDDITLFLETRKANNQQIEEKITTGTLVCESNKNSDTLDYKYTVKFLFRDNKLKKLNYLTEIRGDANLDEQQLTKLNDKCLLVKQYASDLDGIDVLCDNEAGLFKEKQVFTYDAIDRDKAMTAFTEAGGIYPEYKNNQDMDEIERNMNAAAYTCKRIK